MESIAVLMDPYKDIIGSITGIVTIGQMFSGSFICWDIYKQGGTRGIGITPFLGGLVITVLNLKYAFILRDDTMIQVNFVGLALNIVYVMIYFQYSHEKTKVWAQMGLAGAFTAALLGYAQMEDPALVENRFGAILTVLMFYLISAPLFDLKSIIKNKSTEGLPFPMILSGTVVTFMWLLYGIILRNQFLLLQNVIALMLCSAQLSLFVIYPSKPKGTDKKTKEKAKKAD